MTLIEELEEIEEINKIEKGNVSEEYKLEEHVDYLDSEISRLLKNIEYYRYIIEKLISDRKKLDSEIKLDFREIDKFNSEYKKELEYYISKIKDTLENRPKRDVFNNQGDVKGIVLPPNLLKVLEVRIGIQKKEVNKHNLLFNEIDNLDLEIQKNNTALARTNRELESLFKSREKLKKKLTKKLEKDKTTRNKFFKLNTDLFRKLKTNFFKSN